MKKAMIQRYVPIALFGAVLFSLPTQVMAQSVSTDADESSIISEDNFQEKFQGDQGMDGIIDVGDLPDGMVEGEDDGIFGKGTSFPVAEAQDKIIDVGDLPDGMVEGEADGVFGEGLALSGAEGQAGDAEDITPGPYDVAEAQDKIIDVGDLPDGMVEGEADGVFGEGPALSGAEGQAGDAEDITPGPYDVAEAQDKIIDVGDLPDGIVEGEADGVFGEGPALSGAEGQAGDAEDITPGPYDVAEAQDKIIDVGDLPDGMVEGEADGLFGKGTSFPVAEAQDKIIDVGDLPDGMVEGEADGIFGKGTTFPVAEGKTADAEDITPGPYDVAEVKADNEFNKTSLESDEKNVSQNEPLTHEIDPNKDLVEMPESEMRELQRAMAEISREDPGLFRELSQVMATEVELVVLAAPEHSPGATPDGVGPQMNNPGGANDGLSPVMDISSSTGKQQALGELDTRAKQMMASGVSEGDITKMRQAIVSGDQGAMQEMMQGAMEVMGPPLGENGEPMPGMDPMGGPGGPMGPGPVGPGGPMVVEMNHFFQGVQMESMAIVMEEKGLAPDVVREMVNHGMEMIDQGMGQQAFGQVQQMAMERFQGPGGPGAGDAPRGGPIGPDVTSPEGREMALAEFGNHTDQMAQMGMNAGDMEKMKEAIASGDQAAIEGMMQEFGMGPGGPGDPMMGVDGPIDFAQGPGADFMIQGPGGEFFGPGPGGEFFGPGPGGDFFGPGPEGDFLAQGPGGEFFGPGHEGDFFAGGEGEFFGPPPPEFEHDLDHVQGNPPPDFIPEGCDSSCQFQLALSTAQMIADYNVNLTAVDANGSIQGIDLNTEALSTGELATVRGQLKNPAENLFFYEELWEEVQSGIDAAREEAICNLNDANSSEQLNAHCNTGAHDGHGH